MITRTIGSPGTMAPPFAVLWLRSHFDEIEAKVAS